MAGKEEEQEGGGLAFARQSFSSLEAERRWRCREPRRVLDSSLGRPILVCDDNGEYVSPSAQDVVAMDSAGLCGDGSSNEDEGFEALESVAEKIRAAYLGPVTNSEREAAAAGKRSSLRAVHGSGVFALADIPPGAFVGVYGGFVMTEEEAEDAEEEEVTTRPTAAAAAAATTAAIGAGVSTTTTTTTTREAATPLPHHIFHIHHGAFGVCVDGSHGDGRNALSSINHSCAPNAVMREVYCCGTWNVGVFALPQGGGISAGEELTHDYALTTEDSEDPRLKIACTCGAGGGRCRGSLWSLEEW